MEMIDITKKSDKDLQTLRAEYQGTIAEMRKKVAMLTEKNVRGLRDARKTLARINTEIRRRALEENKQ